MEQLILVSHGTFCEHLKKSTEMIMGPQSNIHALALLPEEGPEEFKARLDELVSTFDSFTIFADLAGGTPCNVAAKMLIAGQKFDLYAGMNMPMVISFINGEMVGIDAQIVADGQAGVSYINDVLLADDDDEDE